MDEKRINSEWTSCITKHRQLLTLFDPGGVDLRGVSVLLTERSLSTEIKLKEIKISRN